MEGTLVEQAQRLWREYDATVSEAVFTGLSRAGFKEIVDDPSSLTKDLPFVASPTPLLTCIAAYLFIVVAGIGYYNVFPSKPKADPLWLRLLVQAHNLFLIGLSSYMCGAACYYAWAYGYRFWGQGYDPSEMGMARTVWIFYVSKIYEFMDTFIMLMKGKVNQVSFLHVYHHASVSSIWWAISYVAPGGDAWYCVMLNSLVHVLMYTYYFIAAALGKDERAKKKYLWWGRYLTQFQMFQFVTMMGLAVYSFNFSPYPRFITGLLFFYMITLLSLFANFYMRKHGASKKRKVA